MIVQLLFARNKHHNIRLDELTDLSQRIEPTAGDSQWQTFFHME